MEQPPAPKRQRAQSLQQAAAEVDGGARAPQPASLGPGAVLLPLLLAPPPTPAVAIDGSYDCTRVLLPELLQRIAGFMHCNEVACSLRLVCTAAAAALAGPRYTTVRLSEPSPPAAFAKQWSGLGALRSLTRKQRDQLELLTARSGSIANLQTLAARGDLPLLSRHPNDWEPLLAAAARSGRLELCSWLRQQGTPVGKEAIIAAAEGGSLAVVESLLGASPDAYAASAVSVAVRHGHVHVMEWLLPRADVYEVVDPVDAWCVAAAAHGCTLDVLQRLHARFESGRQQELRQYDLLTWLSAAGGSPTHDWQAKMEWLEALGCPRSSDACKTAARQPDALARLQWLEARGYALHARAALAAAAAGNAEALQHLLARGVQLTAEQAHVAIDLAARHGYLSAVQVLCAPMGVDSIRRVVEPAAGCGQLHVVEWAAEQLGAGLGLSTDLFQSAARSGSWPLLRWLHERGCPWDAYVFSTAVRGCSEEALEWLVERGCPMGDGGEAYTAAMSPWDSYTLRCLRRLGCPFAPDGGTFTAAVRQLWYRKDCRTHLLWLLDAGCPVDWAVNGGADLRSWLEEQRRQRTGGL